MDHTQAGLRQRVRDKLNDQEFDGDFINNALNEAYFEVFGEDEYSFLEKVYNIAACNSGDINLPKDHQTTLRVVARNKNGQHTLKYITFRQFASGVGKGHFNYTMFADEMTVRLPKVNDTDDIYDLKHYYLAKPIAMSSDSAVPLFPQEYDEILVLGALKRCEERRDNFDYAAIYENERLEKVENMRLRYGPRQSDQGSRARVIYGSYPLG